MIVKCKNEQETIHLAECFASFLQGGEIILLNGDLGCGKTTFVKGIAKHFQIKKPITSPTFTIMKNYPIDKGMLVHVDAYRLEGADFIELEDFLNDENIVFIEWSNYLKSQAFFSENMTIEMEYISKNQRKITFIPHGRKYEEILQRMMENV